MSDISGLDADTSHHTEGAPRVLLAGSFISFSDRIVSLLQKEFPEFSFQRVAEAALGDAFPTDDLHLLICEEGVAAKVLGLPDRGRANVAVAFNDISSIRARLAELGADSLPIGLSLLPMNVRIDVWLSIIRLLLCGESYVPMSLLPSLADLSEGRAPAPRAVVTAEEAVDAAEAVGRHDPVLQKLTDRERKVLPLIAQGKQNKVIAEELNMSEHTVKLHVHHIISKLGMRNRTEVTSFYLASQRGTVRQ